MPGAVPGFRRRAADLARTGPGSAFPLVALAFILLTGCAAPQPTRLSRPAFDFRTDTLSYANGLIWEYSYDADGRWRGRSREPRPDYTHHCFVVARAAKQFFLNARFEPGLPRTNADTYRQLVRRVVASSPRHLLPADARIVIPGYANLREFSTDYEQCLKQECGSFWQSYFQRGHWRMVFPFSRSGQEQAARELLETTRSGRPAVVHVAAFPSLRINHALLVYRGEENSRGIFFDVYDPNNPDHPTVLTFDRGDRRFRFPANDYYPGGALNVYEVYSSWAR